MVYLLGDLNIYDKRFDKFDTSKIIKTSNNIPMKLFDRFMGLIPTPVFIHNQNPKHFPKQKAFKSCARLDYIMVLYYDKYPTVKVKEIVTKSDQLAVIFNINVPHVRNIEIKFEKFQKMVNLDYSLIDETLDSLCQSLDWAADPIGSFGQYDIARKFLLESCCNFKTKTRSSNYKNRNFDYVGILQNKAVKAFNKNDMKSFQNLTDEIQHAVTSTTEKLMSTATISTDSKSFYKWAENVLKPVKKRLVNSLCQIKILMRWPI